MKPYPRFKPFPEVWLPRIPSSWSMRKIKYLFRDRSEKGFPNEPLLAATQNHGVIPKTDYENRTVEAQKDLHLLKLVRVGDFVISLRSFQGGIEYAYHQGIISPAYTIMVPLGDILPGYFRHLAKSGPFLDLLKLCVTGIREGQNIDYERLKKHFIPLPPPDEQTRIVQYLDEKTAAIDELMRAKERQIELLRERKQALVSAAVTRGLDPATKLKDSGPSWIGKIPAHWEVVKLRQILSPFSEKNRPDLPLLSVVREKGVIVRDKDDMEENHNFIPDDLSGYKVVRKGQFVMNKMKAWQGSYGISPCDGIVSPAYFVFNIRLDNLSFFHFAIRSRTYVNFFAQASEGIRIGQWDLNLAKMKEIPFLVPPAEEQRDIVERLPKLFSEMDRKIAHAERSIALLQELRTRLVSDAVTGAVEV